MKILILIAFILNCISLNAATYTEEKSIADNIYIPINLVDSVKKEIKAMTKDKFVSQYHFGSGMWIRNSWGLWKGSRLSKSFNSLCIYHPHDMSGINFTTYHRKMTGKKIARKAQVKYCQKYWKK